MSGFDQLHPALQHHLVNSLGWRELRPFQDMVIPKVLAGEHLIVLAPTAGGKTEAAFLPTLSRMLTEDWSGLSVLYVCPIKALLNNLDQRLSYYCGLVGRQCGLWHGDVGAGARKRLIREQPDCLLTTPESLEVMLISRTIDDERLFANLKMIIVDEVHAFAGDDRGWHLLSVLERVSKLAGREIQRIGLSATVGNPEVLLNWLAGNCAGSKSVFYPPASAPAPADVQIDYVGSLTNAATVISRLHRGQKRLVFLDSRAGTEELGLQLRQLGVNTFVTHSSLSQDERQRTEAAFAEGNDCVIVATSVLELGIDVGDLDRVIQIDAPQTVASFLQRMGRTGRRAGTTRNCLMLTTKPERMLQAAALVQLWDDGYVEPVVPPPAPLHILAQQLMALALQQGGIGKRDWFSWVAKVPAFSSMPRETVEELVEWMISSSILSDDAGILWLGEKGEQKYGHKNFMDLFTVFMTPPLFKVLHGRNEIGQVDESAVLFKEDSDRVLGLGGNAWKVTFIDWPRKVIYVEPTDIEAKTRWPGSGIGLSFDLCQSMKRLLCQDTFSPRWSQRGSKEIARLREEFDWLEPSGSTLVFDGDQGSTWWTFAGRKANTTLAQQLSKKLDLSISNDGFSLKIPGAATTETIVSESLLLKDIGPSNVAPIADAGALKGLKFSACLPLDAGSKVLSERLRDDRGLGEILNGPIAVQVHADASKLSIGHRKPSLIKPSNKPKAVAQPRPTADTTMHSAGTSTPGHPDPTMRALSIRQPWAELIMLGEKTVEYRSQPTKVRGTVYIYASATRYAPEDEAEWAEDYGFDMNALPRGVIIGTVDIVGCSASDSDGYEWALENPCRIEPQLRPVNHPNPVWFFPFQSSHAI